jgi:hypothetical protein
MREVPGVRIPRVSRRGDGVNSGIISGDAPGVVSRKFATHVFFWFCVRARLQSCRKGPKIKRALAPENCSLKCFDSSSYSLNFRDATLVWFAAHRGVEERENENQDHQRGQRVEYPAPMRSAREPQVPHEGEVKGRGR